nr:HAMP domain-containing histidine kinase [Pseudomonadota bacterium]
LEEADRRKDKFLATLAHELRDPLAALSLAGQRLRLPGAGDRLPWVADVIEQQTTHMLHLVEELLDVARVRQDKVHLAMEPMDLALVAARAAEANRALVERSHHVFEIRSPGNPVWVRGDATRVYQIISNLLTNAARYTPVAGHIWLEVDKDDQQAIIRVRDTGIGIPTEMQSDIFKLFNQAEHPNAAVQGGLGIGLALVEKLVAMHGGTVAVSSKGLDQGSEFVVRIPLLIDQQH